MSERFPITVKVADLQLGDVLELFEGPYGTATVKQIRDGQVTLFRPYAATADFSTTSGVICYTGIEECKYLIGSNAKFKVYSRKELK
jgi:hypothetical protein